MTASRFRLQSRIGAALACAVIVAAAANHLLALPRGLRAIYYAGPDWRDDRGGARVTDPELSTAVLKRRRPDFAARPFSVEWQGFVVIPRRATFTWRTVSDDGSWVFVDGREVVANGGIHPATTAEGSIQLDAGLHPIFIRYFQAGGDCAFELTWSRDGGPFEPLPSWALLTGRTSLGRVRASRIAHAALIGAGVAVYIAAATVLIAIVAAAARRLFAVPWQHAGFRWVLAVSVFLNVWGIGWALPNVRGWAPDEVVPLDVIAALGRGFAGGWHEKYPPFHYLVLAAAHSPVLILSALGLVDLRGAAAGVTMALIGRAVSVAFAAGTIAVMDRCGLQLYGATGAAFAAAITALTVPFAYYSKLANLDVPYLFWFALSLLAYIRILQRHERRDYLLFAASAALAGCTKDQAWGLYFATPIAILFARWQAKRGSGEPLVRVIVNPTTLQAAAVGVATFLVADTVLYNFSGFVAHVKLLIGTPGPFQAFPRTFGGELQMAWRAVEEIRYMAGWPLFAILVVAFADGLIRTTTRPSLRWLLVPAVSYYASFVGVILFYFDRYFLPITMVLALFAGNWLERFLASGVRARRARLALVSAALAYTAVYAASVNYMMTFDSRYAVTRWFDAHAGPDRAIASPGPLEFSMLAGDFRWQRVASVADVAALRPAFIVMSPDLMPNEESEVRSMRDWLMGGDSGYRLALSVRTPPPLPGGHPDLDERARHGPEYSDLAMINPRMEIFERVR